MADNLLFYGDNLDVLRRHIADASVDLVYLDPPFNSDQTYNVLFAEQDGSRAAAQIRAFGDTWRWDQAAAAAFEAVVEQGGKVAEALRGLRTVLGDSDMLAYLAMMAPRLVELRRVLKPSGSLYLHCDPTADAYLRLLLDAVFGGDAFQNQIIWSYRRWPSPSNHFQRMHDVILFYANGTEGPRTFHVDYEANSASYQKRFKGKTQMLDPETRTRKITLEAESRGLPQRDVWDISIIAGFAKERLGYPTQKPLALLERIIAASSNPGDTVLDPFCGCGTTIDAAQKLGRRWIGIDVTHLAITLIKTRLQHTYGPAAAYSVLGEPTTADDAADLAASDPYQFQWWALGLVGARPVEGKKGADQGVDGRLYFHDEAEGGPTKQVIFSVKAGHATVAHLRDLRGVVEREGAALGVLLTMEEATRPMRTEAAGAGYYESPGWHTKHPRLQLFTIAELLEGKRVDMPPVKHTNVTFKRAPKATKADAEVIELGLGEPRKLMLVAEPPPEPYTAKPTRPARRKK